jgi:hypothetical protein
VVLHHLVEVGKYIQEVLVLVRHVWLVDLVVFSQEVADYQDPVILLDGAIVVQDVQDLVLTV